MSSSDLLLLERTMLPSRISEYFTPPISVSQSISPLYTFSVKYMFSGTLYMLHVTMYSPPL